MRTSSLFPTRHIVRLGEGALLGFVAGMVTVLYRYLLEQASSVSEQVLTLARESVFLALAWLAFLGFLGWVVGYLVRFEPLAAGSGIPHVKGVLSGKLQAVWWRILLVKFAGGILGTFGGLSLGREGPSVQIGAMIGKGWGEILLPPPYRWSSPREHFRRALGENGRYLFYSHQQPHCPGDGWILLGHHQGPYHRERPHRRNNRFVLRPPGHRLCVPCGPRDFQPPQDEANLRYPPEEASPHHYEPYPPATTRT
jgi:hypothetical protein